METNIEAIIDEYINHILTFGTAPTSDWLRTQLTFLLSKQLDEVVEEIERIATLYRKAQYGLDDEILNHIRSALSHQRELLLDSKK